MNIASPEEFKLKSKRKGVSLKSLIYSEVQSFTQIGVDFLLLCKRKGWNVWESSQ